MDTKDLLEGLDPEDKEQIKDISLKILKKMRQDGGSLASTLNLSEDLLEEIYQLGYTYYNQGKLKEAVSLFYVLVGVSPKNFKFVLALSAAYHQLEDFYHAALGFTLAFTLDPKNPLPAYYAGDSLVKMNQIDEALEVFDKAIEVCGNHPEHAALKERCVLIKNSFNTQDVES